MKTGTKVIDLHPNCFGFVTTRHGGTGLGAYASFNCSPYCGDEPDTVIQNQRLLLDAFPHPPKHLIIPQQNHGLEVRCVDARYLTLPVERQAEWLCGVDALITDQIGCCICVSTADCIPILLFDSIHRVAAVVHAGWRGTISRILSKTLTIMRERYHTVGSDVYAYIGPGISAESFEVGEEVVQAFEDANYDMPLLLHRHSPTNKAHIDLFEANRTQLITFGVPDHQITLSNICTYQQHNTYFSARRLGIQSGRNLSGMMLL